MRDRALRVAADLRSLRRVLPDDQSRAASPPRRLAPERLPDHMDRLYAAALALTRSREDAEDLVQQTFERVLRRPRFLRRDNDLAYLVRVLRNTWYATTKTAARRRSHPTAPEDLEWVPDERVAPERRAEVRAVYEAIAELTPPQRQAVVAVDVVGLSYKEAARALRVREGTIMSRLFRARHRIAELVDGDVDAGAGG